MALHNPETARLVLRINITPVMRCHLYLDKAPGSVPGATATGSLLHLKSGVAYLGDNRLAIIETLAGRKEFAGYDPVLVDQAESYAANCIKVNNHVLIADGYPNFAAKLRELGYQTIALNVSEFQKMDGGLSCLSLRF